MSEHDDESTAREDGHGIDLSLIARPGLTALVHDDPETATAVRGLDRVLRARYFARAQQAFEDRHALPKEWRAVTGMNQMGLYLTPDELKAIDEEIIELLFKRYADRRTPSPDLPEGAERVEILTLAYRL